MGSVGKRSFVALTNSSQTYVGKAMHSLDMCLIVHNPRKRGHCRPVLIQIGAR
jgi:hypothetical protein